MDATIILPFKKKTELVFLFYGLQMVYKPGHQNRLGNTRILFIW